MQLVQFLVLQGRKEKFREVAPYNPERWLLTTQVAWSSHMCECRGVTVSWASVLHLLNGVICWEVGE